MKRVFIAGAFILFTVIVHAQNVGIGVPVPLQKLDVGGAVKIGTTATNQPGSIRFNAGKFEGGDGTNWKSFEGLPSKAIILARTQDTAAIKLAGFYVFRQSNLPDEYYDTTYTNYPGQWVGLSSTNPQDEPMEIYNYESVQYNNKIIYCDFYGTLHQYDIGTQAWSQLPGTNPLSIRTHQSITLVGNTIYIFGGYAYNPATLFNNGAKYNLTTNTWSAVANMPVASFFHASCALGTDIYIIGGSSTNLTVTNQIQLGKKLYKYNTLTNTWSADLTNSSTPFLSQGNAHIRNNKLLLVGDSIREYNPTLNSYSTLAYNITSPSYVYTSAVVLDKVNVFGKILDTIEPVNPGLITYHSQINLLNGQSTVLNTNCNNISIPSPYSYRYVTGINKYVYKNNLGFSAFDPLGSIPTCLMENYHFAYLHYMKKQ